MHRISRNIGSNLLSAQDRRAERTDATDRTSVTDRTDGLTFFFFEEPVAYGYPVMAFVGVFGFHCEFGLG